MRIEVLDNVHVFDAFRHEVSDGMKKLWIGATVGEKARVGHHARIEAREGREWELVNELHGLEDAENDFGSGR